jgi:hypothetical protein
MRLSLRVPGMDGDGALGSGDCLQSRADPEREAVSHTASDHKRNRLKGMLLRNGGSSNAFTIKRSIPKN